MHLVSTNTTGAISTGYIVEVSATNMGIWTNRQQLVVSPGADKHQQCLKPPAEKVASQSPKLLFHIFLDNQDGIARWGHVSVRKTCSFPTILKASSINVFLGGPAFRSHSSVCQFWKTLDIPRTIPMISQFCSFWRPMLHAWSTCFMVKPSFYPPGFMEFNWVQPTKKWWTSFRFPKKHQIIHSHSHSHPSHGWPKHHFSQCQPRINKPQTAVELGRYHKKYQIMTVGGIPP